MIWCDLIWYDIYHTTSHHITFTSRHVTPRHITLHHITSCHETVTFNDGWSDKAPKKGVSIDPVPPGHLSLMCCFCEGVDVARSRLRCFKQVILQVHAGRYLRDAVDCASKSDILFTGLGCSGPVFCLLLGVSFGCAWPIAGHVTSVTWPVVGWA